jgi:hypothetical protein
MKKWRANPQYVVSLTTPARVFVVLAQQDHTLFEGETAPKEIGFFVVRVSDDPNNTPRSFVGSLDGKGAVVYGLNVLPAAARTVSAERMRNFPCIHTDACSHAPACMCELTHSHTHIHTHSQAGARPVRRDSLPRARLRASRALIRAGFLLQSQPA